MARQDWTTLMMLISQTIDPDEWRDFGGTGDSTMLPFPNGVWIDAKGHLKRMERRGLDAGDAADSHQEWLHASGLRVVSLKALDAAVGKLRQSGLATSAQMSQLAGLGHIEYISVDQESHDILLAGPVIESHAQVSGLTLEDLSMLLNRVSKQTQPLGCSLEPRQAGLVAAQQLIGNPVTIARLSRAPQSVAEQLKQQVGSHEVRVFGLDPASATALALVDADELMKRYGLGLSKGAVPLGNYFDHLNRARGVQP